MCVMCVCVCVCVSGKHELTATQRGIGSLGAGILGGCKSPEMSPEIGTLVLWKNSNTLIPPAIPPAPHTVFTSPCCMTWPSESLSDRPVLCLVSSAFLPSGCTPWNVHNWRTYFLIDHRRWSLSSILWLGIWCFKLYAPLRGCELALNECRFLPRFGE